MFSEPVIKLKNISKCYQIYENPRDRLLQMVVRNRKQYFREFWALKDVSLEVRKGECFGIVGRNGAGKSTLLQIICGTLSATHGDIQVQGRVAALLELGAGFTPEFTGKENVYLSAAIMGLSTDEIAARYDEIVSFSGLGDFIDQPVKTYSSGMYVRLAFSVATSVEPDILVIDEALSVGDGAFARKSFDRIMGLRKKGVTILFCSHSTYHIEAICTQALWLDKGQMRMLDHPAKIVSAFNTSLMLDDDSLPKENTENPAGSSTSTGQARIDRIFASADGVSGNNLSLRSCKSDLRLRIEFSSDPQLPILTLAFGVQTISGIAVASAGAATDGIVLQRQDDGSGAVELVFPKLPLMRGTYRLSLFLACENLVHIYDHAPNCVELEITDSGIEQGVVHLPHQWCVAE